MGRPRVYHTEEERKKARCLVQQQYWQRGNLHNRKMDRLRRTGGRKPEAQSMASAGARHPEAVLLPQTAKVTSGTLKPTESVGLDVLAHALTVDARTFRPDTPADWEIHTQICISISDHERTPARRRRAFDKCFKAKLRTIELIAEIADKAENIALELPIETDRDSLKSIKPFGDSDRSSFLPKNRVVFAAGTPKAKAFSTPQLALCLPLKVFMSKSPVPDDSDAESRDGGYLTPSPPLTTVKRRPAVKKFSIPNLNPEILLEPGNLIKLKHEQLTSDVAAAALKKIKDKRTAPPEARTLAEAVVLGCAMDEDRAKLLVKLRKAMHLYEKADVLVELTRIKSRQPLPPPPVASVQSSTGKAITSRASSSIAESLRETLAPSAASISIKDDPPKQRKDRLTPATESANAADKLCPDALYLQLPAKQKNVIATTTMANTIANARSSTGQNATKPPPKASNPDMTTKSKVTDVNKMSNVNVVKPATTTGTTSKPVQSVTVVSTNEKTARPSTAAQAMKSKASATASSMSEKPVTNAATPGPVTKAKATSKTQIASVSEEPAGKPNTSKDDKASVYDGDKEHVQTAEEKDENSGNRSGAQVIPSMTLDFTNDSDDDMMPLRRLGSTIGEQLDLDLLEQIAAPPGSKLLTGLADAYGGVPTMQYVLELATKFSNYITINLVNVNEYAPQDKDGRPPGWQHEMIDVAVEIMCSLAKIVQACTGHSAEAIEAITHATSRLQGHARLYTMFKTFQEDVNPNLPLRRKYDHVIGPGGKVKKNNRQQLWDKWLLDVDVHEGQQVLIKYFLDYPFGSQATNLDVDSEFKDGFEFFLKHFKSFCARTGFEAQFSLVSPRAESTERSQRWSSSGLEGATQFTFGVKEDFLQRAELLYASLMHHLAFYDARIEGVGLGRPSARRFTQVQFPDRVKSLGDAIKQANAAGQKNLERRVRDNHRRSKGRSEAMDGEIDVDLSEDERDAADPSSKPQWASDDIDGRETGVIRTRQHDGTQLVTYSCFLKLPPECFLLNPTLQPVDIVEYSTELAHHINQKLVDELERHGVKDWKPQPGGVRLNELMPLLVKHKLCVVNYLHAVPMPYDPFPVGEKAKGAPSLMKGHEQDLLYTWIHVLGLIKIVKAIFLTPDQQRRLRLPRDEEVLRWPTRFTERPEFFILLTDVIKHLEKDSEVASYGWLHGSRRGTANNGQTCGGSFLVDIRTKNWCPTMRNVQKRKRQAEDGNNDEKPAKKTKTEPAKSSQSSVVKKKRVSTALVNVPSTKNHTLDVSAIDPAARAAAKATAKLKDRQLKQVDRLRAQQGLSVGPAAPPKPKRKFYSLQQYPLHANEVYITVYVHVSDAEAIEDSDDDNLPLMPTPRTLLPSTSSRRSKEYTEPNVPVIRTSLSSTSSHKSKSEKSVESDDNDCLLVPAQRISLSSASSHKGKEHAQNISTHDGKDDEAEPDAAHHLDAMDEDEDEPMPDAMEEDEPAPDAAPDVAPEPDATSVTSNEDECEPDAATIASAEDEPDAEHEDERKPDTASIASNEDEPNTLPDATGNNNDHEPSPDWVMDNDSDKEVEHAMNDDTHPSKDDEPDRMPLLYLPIEVDELYQGPGRYYGLWHDFPNSTFIAKQVIHTAIRHYRKEYPVCPMTTAKQLWRWKKQWTSEVEGYEQPPSAMEELFQFAAATMRNEGLLKDTRSSAPRHSTASPPASPAKATCGAKACKKTADATPEAAIVPPEPHITQPSKKGNGPPKQTTLWVEYKDVNFIGVSSSRKAEQRAQPFAVRVQAAYGKRDGSGDRRDVHATCAQTYRASETQWQAGNKGVGRRQKGSVWTSAKECEDSGNSVQVMQRDVYATSEASKTRYKTTQMQTSRRWWGRAVGISGRGERTWTRRKASGFAPRAWLVRPSGGNDPERRCAVGGARGPVQTAAASSSDERRNNEGDARSSRRRAEGRRQLGAARRRRPVNSCDDQMVPVVRARRRIATASARVVTVARQRGTDETTAERVSG
ncbi:hypothetical protein BKA62DRAFT_675024 [Auriculariales sp. MPI-PUGE-AT-0066]|nr:hypothetical protein BKA62DRAFT_675024 [Auriculariales sp. MPI-PUGE-AT-0066]